MVAIDMVLSVAVATAIGLLLSFVLEQCVLPRPAMFWRRPRATTVMHCGIWIALCGFTLLVWRRPFFMMCNALAMQAVVVGVSVVKFRTLREPFIFADFEYFTDLLRHPRLYLPFFGVWLAVACLLAYGGVVALGLYFETSLVALHGASVYVLAGLMMVCGTTIAWLFGKIPVTMTLDASDDLRQLGLFAALWHYGRLEKDSVLPVKASATFGLLPEKEGRETLPDLVVIQSESFFDIRRQYTQIHPGILSTFDCLKQTAALSGRLRVPAWGANTIRTEFGFLSGMSPSMLGVHQYQPYRALVRQGFPTMATYLKSLGYYTVCIHPYPASFYARDKVYPLLGFDSFLDIGAFADAEYAGQYVSDKAVAQLIRETLNTPRDKPVYVFAITMENHGPLHWDNSADTLADERLLSAPVADEHSDLVNYARHLANADQMFGMVTETLQAQTRPGALCIYGDHVPIMERVYKDLGLPDGLTDYVCWTTAPQQAHSQDIAVDQLAHHFLSVAGVINTERLKQHSA